MAVKTNWKGAERNLRDILIEFLIPAYRKTRGSNFAVSDTDVGITDHDNWKLDSKYSKVQPFRHHGKLEVIKEKYCKEKTDFAVLFTKNYKQTNGCISVDARLFSMLLSFFLGYGDKETLMKIYLKEKDTNGI